MFKVYGVGPFDYTLLETCTLACISASVNFVTFSISLTMLALLRYESIAYDPLLGVRLLSVSGASGNLRRLKSMVS